MSTLFFTWRRTQKNPVLRIKNIPNDTTPGPDMTEMSICLTLLDADRCMRGASNHTKTPQQQKLQGRCLVKPGINNKRIIFPSMAEPSQHDDEPKTFFLCSLGRLSHAPLFHVPLSAHGFSFAPIFPEHKENRPCSKAAGAVRDKCLTMTYSHMEKLHTTIGAK
ncbi:hypothetical protein, partial [Cobetia sp. 1AS1]|uniref:hypothetical protein n=1 Tax=Cobetia sp. 1AS1 TaxID=3040016 RepID=UPI00244963D1